jgi:release factor glutamine methyltransferase
MSESWTILRLLTWTTDYLKSHGSESPRLDAEVLLAHARGCERIMLYAAFDQVVDETIRSRFRVTPDVLIPRPETEFVVVAALDALKEIQNSKSQVANQPLVSDVGTGSGAIAVAIAKHAPHAKIVATDISPAALAIARENASTHQVGGQIEFVEGDLLAPLPAEPQFTVIASNPPYIGESEISTLSPSVVQHEPRPALIAGPTGTEVIERLIPQAAERLLPRGWLILEISPLVAGRVIEQITAGGQFEPPAVTRDLAGLPRVVKARRT